MEGRSNLLVELQVAQDTFLEVLDNESDIASANSWYKVRDGNVFKADLMLKVCVLLRRDVLASRANNSAYDQDSVQEFLKWSEQITVEFATKKATFSKLAFDQVTPPVSL